MLKSKNKAECMVELMEEENGEHADKKMVAIICCLVEENAFKDEEAKFAKENG